MQEAFFGVRVLFCDCIHTKSLHSLSFFFMSVENDPESRSEGVVGTGCFAFPSSCH